MLHVDVVEREKKVYKIKQQVFEKCILKVNVVVDRLYSHNRVIAYENGPAVRLLLVTLTQFGSNLCTLNTFRDNQRNINKQSWVAHTNTND